MRPRQPRVWAPGRPSPGPGPAVSAAAHGHAATRLPCSVMLLKCRIGEVQPNRKSIRFSLEILMLHVSERKGRVVRFFKYFKHRETCVIVKNGFKPSPCVEKVSQRWRPSCVLSCVWRFPTQNLDTLQSNYKVLFQNVNWFMWKFTQIYSVL